MALGRMGDADDSAMVALFLVPDLSGYITDDLIVVDGGYLISWYIVVITNEQP